MKRLLFTTILEDINLPFIFYRIRIRLNRCLLRKSKCTRTCMCVDGTVYLLTFFLCRKFFTIMKTYHLNIHTI